METPKKPLIVDMAEVSRVTADLRTQAAIGLESGAGEFAREIDRGVLFGTFSPSGETQAARNALWAALHRHYENAERQLGLGRALATGLEKALANYTEADDLAAAALNLIDREIAAAAERAGHAEMRHRQGRGAHV